MKSVSRVVIVLPTFGFNPNKAGERTCVFYFNRLSAKVSSRDESFPIDLVIVRVGEFHGSFFVNGLFGLKGHRDFGSNRRNRCS